MPCGRSCNWMPARESNGLLVRAGSDDEPMLVLEAGSPDPPELEIEAPISVAHVFEERRAAAGR